MVDPIELTRTLVRFDTRNPPGRESECMDYLESLLAGLGLRVVRQGFGPGRENLVARREGAGKPMLFTGHVDTVPLGTVEWTHDPFGGDEIDGRIYGRGSSDMKAGVAAMIAAIAADVSPSPTALTLVLTGGEETGAEGAKALADAGLLGEARCIVVGEPTDNELVYGHKGALWLDACCSGITAHGSMPHLGDNALYKAARAVTALADHRFDQEAHPVMGPPTLNVGTMAGGQNINSVADRAGFTIDIRSVAGMDHGALRSQIQQVLGHEVALEDIVDLPPVWSEPSDPIMRSIGKAYVAAAGRNPLPRSVTYFSDASVLTPALGGVPTVICGPGDPTLAHKVDEYCRIDAIHMAQAIYGAFLRGA